MLKKLFLTLLLLLAPSLAFAQLTTNAGGTGLVNISTGSIPFGSVFNIRMGTSSALQFNNSLSRLTVTNASTTNLSDSSLVSGNCVQAGAGGLLTTTGSACGSGGGSSFGQTWEIVGGLLAPTSSINVNIASNRGYFIGGSLFATGSSTTKNTFTGLGAGGVFASTTNTTENTAFGYQALGNQFNAADIGSRQTAIGYQALYSTAGGNANVAIGDQAMVNDLFGNNNVAVGAGSLFFFNNGSQNIAIGKDAFEAANNVNGNIGVGYDLGDFVASDYNILIGYQQAQNLTTGGKNILIGSYVFPTPNTLVSGSNNILIGNELSLPTSASNNMLDIGNIIYGANNFAVLSGIATGTIGIGSSSPYARLSVHANSGELNPTLFAIGSSTVSATSTLFSISNTGSIFTTLANGCVQAASGILTSTGINCGAGGSDPFTHPAFGQSATTSTMIFTTGGLIVNAASSTIQGNLIINGNSTTTNATTTSLFATNAIFTSASTTNLIVSSLGTGATSCVQVSASGLLSATGSACGSGGGSSSDPFTHPIVNGSTASATTSPLAIFNAAYFGSTGTTTITSAGFVGIGSTSPAYPLVVNSTGHTNVDTPPGNIFTSVTNDGSAFNLMHVADYNQNTDSWYLGVQPAPAAGVSGGNVSLGFGYKFNFPAVYLDGLGLDFVNANDTLLGQSSGLLRLNLNGGARFKENISGDNGTVMSFDGTSANGLKIETPFEGKTFAQFSADNGTQLTSPATNVQALVLQGLSGQTADLFVVATSSGNTVGGFDSDGHRFTSGPAPAVSSCGTGSGTVVGDDQGGTITTATAATTCTLTFAKAYKGNSLYCAVTDDSLVGFADISATSTTAVTFGISSALTGGHIYYQCSYHK